MRIEVKRPFYEVVPELFQLAHEWHLFGDGKLWADAEPLYPIEEIETQWQQTSKDKNSVINFIHRFFLLPDQDDNAPDFQRFSDVEDHIEHLWPFLFRNGSQPVKDGSSLLSIPFDYVVPGGRFNEMYYWDSYFTMLGLAHHGHHQMIREMTKNFAYFIDNFGFVPNGNRSYFLSRSQPPFFALMVELLATVEDESVFAAFLPQMVKEHTFWMHPPRVFVLSDGTILNRYADGKSQPREEMYRDDLWEGEKALDPPSFYHHLRSACESGWDFSSRWMKDPQLLTSIHTHDIIPVDLNALLYALEKNIARGCRSLGDNEMADRFIQKAAERKQAMEVYCWNGFWSDFHTDTKTCSSFITAACVVPLFVGLSSKDHAQLTHDCLLENLLQPGGLNTTTLESGQQWDAPNGWAPLQWMAVQGLSNYGFTETAGLIAKRWIKLNDKVYAETGKMLEKYNVVDPHLPGGGGEYPVQDGFGWTNGVYVALKRWLQANE